MLRKLLVFLLLSTSLMAEKVYLSAHGKTFHTNPKCMSLARAVHVLTADSKDAIEHGMKPCGICTKAKSSKPKKGDNGAWAK